MQKHSVAFRTHEFLALAHGTRHLLRAICLALLLAALFATPFRRALASTGYSHMAPLSDYLPKSHAAEIAFARTAAPAPLTDKAEILTLGPHGYDVAVHGTNGFVCLVERSWAHKFTSVQFWNPEHQAPVCYNPAAVRSVLPTYLTRTKWVLSGMSRAKMAKLTDAAEVEKKITPPAVGAMSFMMSKHQVICPDNSPCTHWAPHLMFYYPTDRLPNWGATADRVPIIVARDNMPLNTLYLVLVPQWSDRTPSPAVQW